MRIIGILIILFISSNFLLAQGLEPLGDIKVDKTYNKTTIENLTPKETNANTEIIKEIEPKDTNSISPIEDQTVDMGDLDFEFDNTPITDTYANDIDYESDLEELNKEYNIKKKEIKILDVKDVFRPTVGPVTMEAEKFSFINDGIFTSGTVIVNMDYYNMTIKDTFYKPKKDEYIGSGVDIIFTTCSNKKPHWYIHADKIQIKNNKEKTEFKLKNVTLHLWKMDVFWLPFFNQSISKNKAKGGFPIPIINYNKSRGLGLKYKNTFNISNKFNIDTLVRYSKNYQFQYEINANISFDNEFKDNPYIHETDMTTMIETLNFLGRTSPYKNNTFTGDYKNRPHLTAKIGSTWKEIDDTIDGIDVEKYKTISTRLRYSFDPFGKNSKMNINSLIAPSLSLNYAREKIDPVIKEYINRYNVEAILPYCAGCYKDINVQPYLKFDYTNYQNYRNYRSLSAGVDLSKYYKDDSYWNIRYVYAWEHGTPLFTDESVDEERGIMASGLKNINKKYIIGAWLGHNFKKHKTYKYGLMLGIKEDCFWTSLGYDFQSKKIYAKIGILGF